MTDYYKDKRQMTDEQIAELAPDFATHYSSFDNGVIFENLTEYQIYAEGVFYGKKQKTENSDKTPRKVKPIPRKKFDISEYEFSDSIAEFEVEVCDTLILKSHGAWFSFDKDDAIALAKHFKLTAEDLK